MTVAEEIGTGLLPTVYISDVNIISSGFSNNFEFSPFISIRDSEDENGEFRWYGTILQNLSTVTLLCVTNDFEDSNLEIIEGLNNGTIMPNDNSVLSMIGVEKQTWSLDVFLIDGQTTYHDTDGWRVYDVEISTGGFNFSKDNLKEIYLFTCMHIDLNEAASVLGDGVTADFGGVEIFSSAVVSEKILELDSPIEVPEISTDTENNNTASTKANRGAIHGGNSIPHMAKFLRPIEIDTGFLGENVEVLVTSPFSEMFYSVDKNENVNGNFLFDPKNLIIDNMPIASKMFSVNPQEFNNLFNSMNIGTAEIFRVEMKNGKQILNDRDNVVVSTHNSKGSKFKSKSKFVFENGMKANVTVDELPEFNESMTILDANNLSKQDLSEGSEAGSIEEIEIGNNPRFISFTDKKLGKEEMGEYSHGIRITITNEFDQYVLNKIRRLSMAVSTVNGYYMGAVYGNKFNKFGRVLTKHAETLERAFNNDNETPWIGPVDDFQAAALLISTSGIDSATTSRALNPRTATSSSILDVMEKMNQLINDIKEYYDISETENNFSKTSAKSSANSKKKHTIEHVFSEEMSSSEINLVGLDYFNKESSSIMRISKKDYFARATAEKNKFFKFSPKGLGSKEMSDLNSSMYSYFTPLSIESGGVSTGLTLDLNETIVETIDKIEPEPIDSSSTSPLTGDKKRRGHFRTKNKRKMFNRRMNRLGIIMSRPIKREQKPKKFIDAKEIVGPTSDFIGFEKDFSPSIEEIDEINLKENNKILSAIDINKKDKSNFKISLKTFSNVPPDLDKIKNMPLQLKALFLRNDKSTNFNFEDSDPFADPKTQRAAEINFTKIRKVEILNGFGSGRGLLSLKDPKWEILTKERFDSLEGNVLCRLSPCSVDFYNIKDKDNLKDYDTLFIIEA